MMLTRLRLDGDAWGRGPGARGGGPACLGPADSPGQAHLTGQLAVSIKLRPVPCCVWINGSHTAHCSGKFLF